MANDPSPLLGILLRERTSRLASLAFVLTLAIGNAAQAFAVFPYDDNGDTRYLKWGDNRAGEPGGIVTWSVIPGGTSGSAYCANACPGSSVDAIQVEIAPGQGFQPRSLVALVPQIESALGRWSRVTGLRFIRVSDSGAPINTVDATPPLTGHIRFGAFAFAGGGGVVGYAPPPNGGTGAGDVLFDANSFYQFAPGAEGDSYPTTFAPNDLESLLLHELGHAIGLDHPAIDGNCPVMQVGPACAGRINRELDPDDRAGASFLYGRIFVDGFEPA
jgi:hypothetical protein